jgi:hypothetical protein
VITIEPVRVPAAIGLNETEIVHVPAAGTPFPQVSVSLKSPTAEMDEIESAMLPMFRSKTVCETVAAPIVSSAKKSELGLNATPGSDAGPIFMTNASSSPASVDWKADCVVGKSVEFVVPAR